MPRILSVSEVRNHLYWAAGGPRSGGDGEPTIALLGSLFHQLFGQLTGPDPAFNLSGPLQLADANVESWQTALARHAYTSFVAPSLATNQASLQERGAEAIAYWSAVKSLCDWIAAVLFDQREHGSLEENRARIFAAAEHEVSATLTDTAWNDGVVVQGRVDALLAQRETAQHCVVELKLGRTAPEADLLQAALYHLLLSNGSGHADSRLALMSFEPGRREYFFDAKQLADAQAKLKALIWRLAGGDEIKPANARGVASEPVVKSPPPDHLDVVALAKKLKHAFAEFGAPIELEGEPMSGPTFIRFLAKPQRGVSAKTMTRVGESVWMRLDTSQPPHVALEKGRIAIDVERHDRQNVLFRDLRSVLPPRDRTGVSRFVVGVSVDGKPHFADISRPESAHFLVAGTSGSGKSEWLRSALASLLVSNSSDTLKLALIDPKRTAFSLFAGSAYLWHPLVYSDGVEEMLGELIEEMERRYELLSKAKADNLSEYNVKVDAALPRIVCVCDEYADLLLADKDRRKVIENQISRLGSKARAAGIHLVFATQRPSRDVVKGVIDSNFSGRVALKVAKGIDSRIILEEQGAETLLGRGDLLYKDVGNPVRLQSPFIEKEELEALIR